MTGRKAQIIIVGGGVAGASVTYHLMERGFLDVSCLSLERFATGELLNETAFI